MKKDIKFLMPFLRGLPFIILVIMLSYFASKKYLSYATPMYESTAKLKLAEEDDGETSTKLFKDFDIFTSVNKISTEIEVLKSSSLIEKTLAKIPFSTEIYRMGNVKNVELFNDSPITVEGTFRTYRFYDKRFKIKVDSTRQFLLTIPDSGKKIKGSFGHPINLGYGRILISINGKFMNYRKDIKLSDDYEFEFLSQEKLLDKITQNLDVVAVDKDVPVIRINYKSNVPAKTSLFVNQLAQTYIEDFIETKYKAANTTVDFLNNEIKVASAKLDVSEDKIQSFRKKHNIINIPLETDATLKQLSELKLQETGVKMNLNAVKNLNNYISKGRGNIANLATNYADFNDMLSTEMIKNIKSLQSQKKDLLLKYTTQNEKVKVIDKQIKDLTDYQIESVRNTQKSLQTKYDNISNAISTAEQAFVGLPEKERLLTDMNREYELYEKSYNFLNEKRIDAQIAEAAKISFHKIISPGVTPKKPVSPIGSIITIVALILGFLLSLILVYLFNYIKAKVPDTETIEKNSNIPIAFCTPFINNSADYSKYFLQNIMDLDLKGILKNGNIISVTSYDNENQHLFHSENITNALQLQGKKVLIVDVTGSMKDFVGNDTSNYIDFSSEENMKLTKEKFQNAINEKMKDYDLCIIHNQAISEGTLPSVFMSIAEHNLVIVDSRKTSQKTLQKVEAQKEEFKLKNVWFILNKEGYNPSVYSEIKKEFFKNKNEKNPKNNEVFSFFGICRPSNF